MAIKIDYDFIKSEEAKQIYIKLERERMLKEKYEDDEDDLDSIFTFEDEEKKKMVERFVFEAEFRTKVLKLLKR